MEKIKVGIAMSGGVDSTATALMLREHYNVSGYFMQLAQPDLEKQISRVSDIAGKIDIPLHIVDLSRSFEEKVLNYFRDAYYQGQTPNPCMICNREIKFGLFMEAILASGMSKIATGHYARVREEDGSFHLLKGCDFKKDQSYFLARLTQQQLSRIIFPLGEMTKTEIYDYAESMGFSGFRGKESQDVCFLEKTQIGDFLMIYDGQSAIPGEIKTRDGKILGSHSGIHNYTIGQRKGLGISDASPYYVIALDASENTVIVGKADDLLMDSIILSNLHWINARALDTQSLFQVKIRNTHPGCPASITEIDDEHCRLKFTEPQRAITPGQFAVLYDKDEVIGSGCIN